MTGFVRFFRRFPQINIGGDSAHFPPLEDAPASLASLAHKRVGCNTMHLESPDEDIMALLEDKLEDKDRDKWIVWFDGTSNTLGHGVGVALVSPDNQCIPFMARLGFHCTNKMAEYEACALRIQAAIDFNIKLLKVYGDSLGDSPAEGRMGD